MNTVANRPIHVTLIILFIGFGSLVALFGIMWLALSGRAAIPDALPTLAFGGMMGLLGLLKSTHTEAASSPCSQEAVCPHCRQRHSPRRRRRIRVSRRASRP